MPPVAPMTRPEIQELIPCVNEGVDGSGYDAGTDQRQDNSGKYLESICTINISSFFDTNWNRLKEANQHPNCVRNTEGHIHQHQTHPGIGQT